nr:hypothetical protein [Tanacetum cinerariifolium]
MSLLLREMVQSIDPPLSTGYTVGSIEDGMEHDIEFTDHIPQTHHDSPLSGGGFVPQKALSREELYFSNNSKTANVSKLISTPNEDFSDDTTPSVARKFLNEEAAKFVEDFKSLAKEANDSLAKHKALELEIERLLKAVVSQDVMNIVQKESVVDTLDLQTELVRTKERFENCIIKKETKYAKLWNDWYKKCDEWKYDKISYDKAYKDMQQKIKRLQAQLGDPKGKSKDTSSLFKKISDQKDNTQNTSENTKFAKQPIMENLSKVGETNSLSNPVTSNSVSTPQESKGVNNDKVIAPGMFRIDPFKTSREEKHVPNTVSASARTKPITVSQPHVITKKDVNSDLNGLSSTGVDNTKTIRPQPRSNTKNDRIPSASKSSRSKNKEAEVEEHHRNLLLFKNNKHISSACNNIKTDSQEVISNVVCAMCSKCLISVNHDKCLCNYVNDKNSRGKTEKAKVSFKENQLKYQPKVTKPKKVECHKSLATPKPRKSRLLFRWSPTGKLFNQEGKIVDSSESKSKSDCSNGDNACTSNILEPKIKRFPNSTSLLDRNDHVAAILGFGDLQWGNILIIRVYFVQGLGHNLFSVGQFCDSNLEVAFRRDACFVRNLEGVDLLKGDCSTNLYTINLHEMAFASPIYLMARKSKRASHPPKPVPNSRQRLHLLHMDLCGPMRIASINGKRYVLVIVDDYSRYTWVHFLRSKDEAPEVIIKFLKRITVLLQSPVIIIRTDNGTEFKNQVLKEYFDNAIATACFTQNRSIIHYRFNKTQYELINGRKPDISFLHVFGALCYPKNDREDIGKLGVKGDIGCFIGYSADSCAYRVYNRRTKKIMETMNVSFDELSAMAFEQRSLKPGLNSMTSGQISSGLDLTYAPSTISSQKPSEGELDLLFESIYDDYIGGQPSATARTVLPAQEPQDVDELNPNAMVDGNTFVNPFANSSTSAAASSSHQNVDPSNMHTFYQRYPHEFQ